MSDTLRAPRTPSVFAPSRRHALLLLAGSLAAAGGAKALRPTRHLASGLGPIQLEKSVPLQIGPWEVQKYQAATVVNPEIDELLGKLYSEILTRTYVHRDTGYRIMLSVAYGGDQSDSLSLHYPDVCYPAQGFQLKGRRDVLLTTQQGTIPVRQLHTQMGARHEPVTYWVVIGDRVVSTGVQRKWIQLQYAAQGWIPDGLLFRVSSIDADTEGAYEQQFAFVRALAPQLSSATRKRLLGMA